MLAADPIDGDSITPAIPPPPVVHVILMLLNVNTAFCVTLAVLATATAVDTTVPFTNQAADAVFDIDPLIANTKPSTTIATFTLRITIELISHPSISADH